LHTIPKYLATARLPLILYNLLSAVITLYFMNVRRVIDVWNYLPENINSTQLNSTPPEGG